LAAASRIAFRLTTRMTNLRIMRSLCQSENLRARGHGGWHILNRLRRLRVAYALRFRFVRRTLPAIRLDLFATFLDGMRHGIQIHAINRTYEAHKVLARRSGGHGEAAREIQDLLLPRSVHAGNFL
jgi:hypothetical protein